MSTQNITTKGDTNQHKSIKTEKEITSMKKSITELNFLNSSGFTRAKQASLTKEEIEIKTDNFKKKNMLPASKEIKNFFSYWNTGRMNCHKLMKELFPKQFFDRNMVD